LIIAKGGLIDDERLMFNYIPDPLITDIKIEDKEMGLIPFAIAHFRLLRITYNNPDALSNSQKSKFSSLVYPRELDNLIKMRIIDLSQILKGK